MAVDPHKWLYAPLEAGCVLVRRPEDLRECVLVSSAVLPASRTRSLNFVDYGPQNSRGFRALKVWLALQQVGRAGYVAVDRRRHAAVAPARTSCCSSIRDFEALTQNLSITTFRYVPRDLRAGSDDPAAEESLNRLNQDLLDARREERRGVPLERGRRRQIRAARLHRELPHVGRRHRRAAGIDRAPRRACDRPADGVRNTNRRLGDQEKISIDLLCLLISCGPPVCILF